MGNEEKETKPARKQSNKTKELKHGDEHLFLQHRGEGNMSPRAWLISQPGLLGESQAIKK